MTPADADPSVDSSRSSADPAVPAAPPRNPLKRLYQWVLHWAETPYGTPALFGISFVESSIFPIPPDVLQIALSVSKPRRSFYYAAVNTAGSVLGGIAGWAIGLTLWAALSGFFFQYVPGFTESNFELVRQQYERNAFLAIFTAAFTPIPFKVFTIGAGVFQIPLTTLIAASVLGRAGRFFLVGGCIYWFGPTVKTLLDKYLEVATVVLTVLLIGGFMAIKLLLK